MLRTFIFGFLILISSVLTGQEIHIPKIPVDGGMMGQDTSMYYVPHYIRTPPNMVHSHNFPYPTVIYYPYIQSDSIMMQYRPTYMGNWLFGPRIYYNYSPRRMIIQ